MPTPLTPEQADHLRKTTHKMCVYLFRVEQAMRASGHDARHTFYRDVRNALERLRLISTACLYVGNASGFHMKDGSLTEGPIPPEPEPLPRISNATRIRPPSQRKRGM